MAKVKFTSTKQVTKELFLLVANAEITCIIQTCFDDTGIKSKDTKIEGNMHGATVTPIDGEGEMRDDVILVSNTVMQNVFNDSYPDNSYVGKCFTIKNQGKKSDNNYNSVMIQEHEFTTE